MVGVLKSQDRPEDPLCDAPVKHPARRLAATLAALLVTGLVAVRQRRRRRRNFVFHTLEDAFGLVNIMTKPHLIVYWHIERQERRERHRRAL